jgi:hypothetical protein
MEKELSVSSKFVVDFNYDLKCCKDCLVQPTCNVDLDDCPEAIKEIRENAIHYFAYYYMMKKEYLEQELGQTNANIIEKIADINEGIRKSRYLVRPATDEDGADIVKYVVERYLKL